MEADPIGIKRGQNHLYAYTSNNPIKNTDPDGLVSSSTIGPPSGNTINIDGGIGSCQYYQTRYQQMGCPYYKFVQPLCQSLFLPWTPMSGSSPCVRQCLQEADMMGYAWDNCSKSSGCDSCPSINCLYQTHMRCFNWCSSTFLQHLY